MKVSLILLLLPWQLLFASDISFDLENNKSKNLNTRVRLWAERFLEKPYGKEGPLGEGTDGEFDRDPLYRFDRFDCTTFVETISSLSAARNFEQFEILMNEIRYDSGRVSFISRNHITSLDWIPHNIKNGRLTEMTTSFLSDFQKVASAEIDKRSWYDKMKLSRIQEVNESDRKKRKLLKKLRKLGKNFSVEMVDLPYLDIRTLLSNWQAFREDFTGPYVLNIITPNLDLKSKIGTSLNVSHQAIVFLQGNVIQMIHASSSRGKVVKTNLKDYLTKFRHSKSVKGINLLKINE